MNRRMIRKVPELQPVTARGLSFAIWHWPGSGPRLLFIHATGFHSRLWDQVIAHLDQYDCWAFDMRGHGQSDKPPLPYIWSDFGTDTAALLRLLDLQIDLGIGHSMGGHTIALAGAIQPSSIRSMILIDPIIIGQKYYGKVTKVGHPVEKRQNHWDSWQQMFERFQGKKPFDTWNEEVLKDYCRYGLWPDTANGGFTLACPPAIEGSIYNHAHDLSANIYKEIETIEAPVLVMRAKTGPNQKTEDLIPPDLDSYFKNGRDLYLPEQTHFIPMEVPELVAREIQQMAGSL